MPSDFEIDKTLRLVRCRAWGNVTYGELSATRSEFEKHEAFRADFFQLYDLQGVTKSEITSAQVREIANSSPFSLGSRRAIVAPQDVIFGLVRMYIAELEGAGGKEKINVFRSLEDAERWLGVPDEKPRG